RIDDLSAAPRRKYPAQPCEEHGPERRSPDHRDEKSPGNFSGGRSVAENCRNQNNRRRSPRNKPVDSSFRKVVRVAPRAYAFRRLPLAVKRGALDYSFARTGQRFG